MGRRGDHRSLIEAIEALVREDPTAYVTDRHGWVANPDTQCELRDAMHRLAELLLERDGRYPSWWRAVGEVPVTVPWPCPPSFCP